MLPQDFRRLEEMEAGVVECLQLAAELMESLSNLGGSDQQAVVNIATRCAEIVKNVQEGIKETITSVAERNFEANVYTNMFESALVQHKLDACKLFLQRLNAPRSS